MVLSAAAFEIDSYYEEANNGASNSANTINKVINDYSDYEEYIIKDNTSRTNIFYMKHDTYDFGAILQEFMADQRQLCLLIINI